MRILTIGSRTAALFLALTLVGLTGFVNPVLCIASDGRVRLEMDASGCRPAAAAPCGDSHAQDRSEASDPLSCVASEAGCGDCTDIHFSAKGLRAPTQPRSPMPPRAVLDLPPLAPALLSAPPSPPDSVHPPPFPPAPLLC